MRQAFNCGVLRVVGKNHKRRRPETVYVGSVYLDLDEQQEDLPFEMVVEDLANRRIPTEVLSRLPIRRFG
jgi:hypothetical protein